MDRDLRDVLARGPFIVIDGIDGCGKSTQVKRLNKAARDAHLDPEFVHEPGGTPTSDRIREILMDDGSINDWSELFLFMAARAQLLEDRND